MMQQIERIRRRLWTYGQPIAHVPSQRAVPISDLFAWRNSSEWETYFEVYNIPALLDAQTAGQQTIQLSLFDQNGNLMKNHVLTVENGKRNTISLREYLPSNSDECGTFAVFHLQHPDSISRLGCFVAERGYVSYRYKNSPLRSYVHGNLDAVARLNKGKLELLGANSFRKRGFCLQLLNEGFSSTELLLVNPTRHLQKLECCFVSANNRRPLDSTSITIPSGGVRSISRNIECDNPSYFEIKSRLVMARPVVFTFQGSAMNVFHG